MDKLMLSVVSGVVNLNKDVFDFEQELSFICKGEIIRWAIIGVTEEFYNVSYSYKK
jgi:hypothetical protein